MLLETIRCENGLPKHLPYHQKRLDNSLSFLGFQNSYDLAALLSPPQNGLFRCRFLYGSNGYLIEYIPYIPRKISSLKIIHADTLDYSLKYSDRSALDLLYAQRGENDDVLIVRNGFVSDTSIANVAFFIDGRWLTPKDPLLEGTARSRLLDDGFLLTQQLTLQDITHAEKFAVMNAMMGFIEVENGIIH